MKAEVSLAYFIDEKGHRCEDDEICVFYSNVRVGGSAEWTEGLVAAARERIAADFAADVREYCPELPASWKPVIEWNAVD